tara:strand:+ start:1018 stop:1386 length:369 start_codon:yes stop_codon:yes gene_type:complete
MGIKNRLRNLFNKTADADQAPPKEEEQLIDDETQFLAMSKEISDGLIDELINDEEDTQADLEPILISEYDAGDIEAEQLVEEEASMSSYNDVNVVNHDSLEDIEEHLEGAEIIGDVPEEITF